MIRLAIFTAPLLLVTACTTFGITCQPGTAQCGQGCADLKFDNKNCGACGNGCAANQACMGGSCGCVTGTTQCGGLCVSVATDPQNCGNGCAGDGGVMCASTEVCEGGQCKAGCELGVDIPCGGGCFNVSSDPLKCGSTCADAVACAQGQACHSGVCTYEVVAACFSSGEIVGMNANGIRASGTVHLGSGPASLASFGTRLLSADGDDHAMYQADLRTLAAGTLVTAIGGASNQVIVDSPFAYVINSGDDTLQILIADGGATAAGQPFSTIGELNFGMNTFPEAVTKLNGALWVPLNGGSGALLADAGQRVVKVDISNPTSPSVVATIDLRGINLHAFDGGVSEARPFAVVAHRGSIYVPLNNLEPDTFAPAGPGMLAKIDPNDAGFSTIVLDSTACLDPVWAVSDGTHLFVSCYGAAVYDSDAGFALVRSTAAGVVMLDENDAMMSSWEAKCPADGGSCLPILPSRMTIAQGKLFLGDGNGGRVFGFDITDAGLIERIGYANGNTPIAACPVDMTTHVANVADLLAVP